VRTIRLTATTVTAAYLAVGTAWVAASDIAASDLPDWVGTAKGMAFVCLTGAPLWVMLRRRDRAIAAREETLLAAHARLSAVAESEGTFTCLFDADGRIRYATRSVASVLGMTADELHERDSLQLVHPADRTGCAGPTAATGGCARR
jgi:PAS domain-containing protein